MKVTKQEGVTAAPIVCGYIPDGFVLEKENTFEGGSEKLYINGNVFISATKYENYGRVKIDTEFRDPKEITHNGITYTIAGEENCPIILWMDPETQCLYNISGDNIREGELLMVAYRTR